MSHGKLLELISCHFQMYSITEYIHHFSSNKLMHKHFVKF